MKLSRVAGLLAGVGVLVFGQVALAASSGTITFEGKITDSTCDIVGNGPDFTVVLPTVSASTLNAANITAGWTQFNIELSNCTVTTLSKVNAYFQAGSTVNSATGRMRNQDSAGAQNVEVALRDLDGIANITIGGQQSTQGVDVSGGTGILSYSAGYWATGAATPGPVKTSVEYVLAYL